MGLTQALSVYFSFFSHDKNGTNLTINDKSKNGVLGTRTRGVKMVCHTNPLSFGNFLFGIAKIR